MLLTAIKNLVSILIEKISGKRKDYFIQFKYENIKSYYGKKCLDIGAGTGYFSYFLKNKGFEITPIDIVDKSTFDVQIQKFDGKKLPFPDKSFDTSVFMFVLHHTDNQIELLKEAIRVTKNHLIIGEDIIESRFDSIMGNIHLNTSPWTKGNDSFHSEKIWFGIFAKLQLKVAEIVKIPRSVYPVYPVSRRIFILEMK
jgi:SAM-dependent methyltransferase